MRRKMYVGLLLIASPVAAQGKATPREAAVAQVAECAGRATCLVARYGWARRSADSAAAAAAQAQARREDARVRRQIALRDSLARADSLDRPRRDSVSMAASDSLIARLKYVRTSGPYDDRVRACAKEQGLQPDSSAANGRRVRFNEQDFWAASSLTMGEAHRALSGCVNRR